MLDLTIAIPVRNEEKNLPGCLNAIGNDLARRIIVIDSGSTDRTQEIAREFGAEIVEFQWNGKFPKKRNWLLRNHKLYTKWILFLDGDEYLTDEFKVELRKELELGNYKGYWLSYTVYFLGKQLKGGYPLKKLALFQIGAGEYEKIEEDNWSKLDMEIHEHPILQGKIGEIKSKIDHRDFQGLGHYIQKHNDYSSWEANRFLTLSSNKFTDFTWKQKIKYRLFTNVLIGPVFFLISYIFYGGFRDGAIGIAFAIQKMSYFNQVYCKIREMNKIR